MKDGDVLSSRFRVVGDKPIGAGQFAEVFKAVDEDSDRRNPTYVAIKIEREEKTTARESRALRDLQGCPGVCEFLGSGVFREKHPYIVMQLGGENLADIRRAVSEDPNERRHGKSTISWIGVRVLESLRCIHGRGYVHRDVKPSNITVSSVHSTSSVSKRGNGLAVRELLLIDLGLSKKFRTEDRNDEARGTEGSQETAARVQTAFRGSTTYASVNVHAGKEQGPRDDLWSLFYFLAECHEGTLPWRSSKKRRVNDDEDAKRAVFEEKMKYLKHPEQMCPRRGTPIELIEFSRALERLHAPRAVPDYDLLRSILERLDDRLLDWEAAPGAPPAGDAGHADAEHRVESRTKPPPMTKVRAWIEHKETVPRVVRSWVQRIGEELDAAHAAALVSGICAAAIETSNMDDPYVEEYVLRILDEAAQAGRDGRAYVEEKRNAKRKRE